MSLEFNWEPIGNYVNILSGFAFKSKDFIDSGIPVVKIKNIVPPDVVLDDVQYVSEKFLTEKKNYVLSKGDILITLTGSNVNQMASAVGQVAKINFTEPCLLNQRVAKLIPKDESNCNIDYFYYILSTEEMHYNLASRASGSANQANINPTIIKSMETLVPSIEIQNKIVEILKTIDEKINVNKEINKNLEELMKSIFEDYFVNFNFSDNVLFKSSELGEIPSDWNVKTLGDILTTLESGKRPKGGVSEIDEGVPSIGAENILGLGKFNYSKNKLISYEFFNELKKGIIQDQDVLLYKDGAQLGRKSLFMNGFPFDVCCINEHVFRLRSNKEISQFYLYLWLDQPIMTNEIINLNSNSAQPGINQNDVKSLPILVPNLEVMTKFNNILYLMMNKLFDNALEINSLSKLRDTLLPKLMSGEIDVSKINCETL